MAGRIPRTFIDELIGRADIVDVVSSRIQLKKAGREYKACCPFHGEKTPSFTVSQVKQFYHCFGCGAHGTAIGFLMEHDGLGFVEAVEEVAAMVGLDVPREQGEAAPRPGADLYDVLARVCDFYRAALRDDPRAIDYVKNRGITGETAAAFALGFAPDRWDAVLTAVGTDAKARRQLEECGVIKARDSGDGHYDRLRDRIVFPIRDQRGRVVGFGGRVLDKGEPKYLNSPETPVFHKGRELYGLYEARRASRDISRLLVVEGYMDVVGLAEHDIDYAVATLGTSTTSDHLDRMFRATSQVVFCFDGDRAGRAAAWRALENALPGARDGRQMAFLFLPDGHDPDSLVRAEGREAFEARMSDAMPLSEFLVQRLSADIDTATVDGRARLAELARPLVARVPAGVYKTLLLDRLAQAVGLAPDTLAALLDTGQAAPAHRPGQRRPKRRMSAGRGTLVRQAISLLLHYPGIAATVRRPEGLEDVPKKGLPLLVQLLEELTRSPHMSTAGVLERWRDHKAGEHLAALALTEVFVDEKHAADELQTTLNRLVSEEGPRDRADRLLAESARRALSEDEKAELKALLSQGKPRASESANDH